MRTFSFILMAGMTMLLLACGLSASELENQEEEVVAPPVALGTPVDTAVLPASETTTSAMVPLSAVPVSYLGPTSLEERVFASPVIARVRLNSVSSTTELGTTYEGMKYSALLEFNFSVQEYLKGSGADDIMAVWAAAPFFDTQGEAEDALPAIVTARGAQWDDHEAIVFLQEDSRGFLSSTKQADRFYLAWGGSRPMYSPDDGYSISSRHNKLWLPAAAAAGETSQPTGDQQRFLLDVPPAEGTALTITLGEIKTRIAAVTAKLSASDGSEEYTECVRESYYLERKHQYLREVFPDRVNTGSNISPPQTHQFSSGLAGGTVVYVIPEGDPKTPTVPFEVWLDGGDASLFSVATPSQDYRVTTTRPLPGRAYNFHFNHRGPYFSRCDGDTTRYEWTVTVADPEGTLHEAFFDPVTVGTAVAADDSNGVLKPATFTDANGASATLERIAWEPDIGESGTVKLQVNPPTGLTDQEVNFIALDGSIILSLQVSNATVDAANRTLSWTVQSQPWQSEDKLMLRIRKGCSGGTAVTNPGANPGLVSDCDALLAAKDTLRGTATLNWSVDTTITSWDGVTVEGAPQRVTELGLSSRSLTGSIPSSIGSLVELTHLNLSNNTLTGEIPEEIGQLSDLVELRLSGNTLTGCIPLPLKDVTTNDLSSLNLLYCQPPASPMTLSMEISFVPSP